jgi:hypothetical protein
VPAPLFGVDGRAALNATDFRVQGRNNESKDFQHGFTQAKLGGYD